MLDRGETERLETTVLFTQNGIDSIIATTDYTTETLPDFVSPETRYGDVLLDNERAIFCSGKHYLPSSQLISGRTSYGSNKNYTGFHGKYSCGAANLGKWTLLVNINKLCCVWCSLVEGVCLLFINNR